MEFNEKLQELRKQRGLTQEELAEKLYVSRAAISKWESGRGYPGIDSLKAIAAFFSVTVDELLSSGEVLKLAEQDQREKDAHVRDLVFGLLDLCMLLPLFCPLFAERTDGGIRSGSLLSLFLPQNWLWVAFLAVVVGMSLWGVLTLALQNWRADPWVAIKHRASLLINMIATVLFTAALQPYVATFAFALLTVKVFLVCKRR
jgi:transcriptional regulator with XRE-family HTH domain